MVTRLTFTPWQDHDELLLLRKELFWSRNGKDLDKRRKACSHVRFEMRLNLPTHPILGMFAKHVSTRSPCGRGEGISLTKSNRQRS